MNQEPLGVSVALKENVFTRDGLFLLISTFLNSIPVGYINVVPLVYLAEIGYDPSAIGVIYSASAVATTVGLIPCGLLADRYGKKMLLIVGTFLPVVSYAIFGLTLDPSLLTIASLIGGVGFAGGLGAAVASPSLFPLLASCTSKNKRSTIFGVLYGAWAIALTIGSALSFLPNLLSNVFDLSERTAHFDSYFVMSGVAAAALLPILFVNEQSSRNDCDATSRVNSCVPGLGEEKSTGQPRAFTFDAASRLGIVRFSFIFALTGFGLGVLVQLLPTWFNLRYGASETAIGFWMAISNLATIVSIPLIPRLVGRRGDIFVATTTGILASLLLGLMALSVDFEMAATLFAVRSVVLGISWAVVISYMMSIVNENQRGTAVGFTYTSWGVGLSLGTFIGGELFGAGLLTLPFIAAVISYLTSSAALWFFFRNANPPEAVTQLVPRISE